VIHIGDDDFVALAEQLGNAEADKPNERGGVQADGDFFRVIGVDALGNALA